MNRPQMQMKGLAESGVRCQRKPEGGAAVPTTGRHDKASRSKELNILQPPTWADCLTLISLESLTGYNMSETLGLCSWMIGSVISGLLDPHSTKACPSGVLLEMSLRSPTEELACTVPTERVQSSSTPLTPVTL
ncbi:uncharacterized protein CCOS01_15931 [Colletotrichum costaricense]|uniref:Uncharacterized protein n=1 Tax=Colletotrichum costaricense TaxID=1209916 RepID=A0AAJ0DSY9_9PEZI|nr:uncharacterized protein CCOS01_15931 [Colletotrichum costaricense]KAK1508270.1 hypothetical protein CCOS01_15931 [Colletotrichum costaricense]